MTLKVTLPVGYGVDASGLYLTGPDGPVYITESPVGVSKCFVDIDSGDARLEIMYLVDGDLRSVQLPRKDIYGQSWLNALGSLDRFPHPPGESKRLRQYLYDAGNEAPVEYFSTTGGWKDHNGKKEFVPFGPVVINPVSEGIRQRFQYLHQKGSFEVWSREVFNALCLNRRACVPFAGAVVAPFLSLLNAESFVIDIHNTSSSGKTIAATMAMSVWGCGHGLKMNWDTTAIGVEQSAAAFTDMPLLFDESQSNKDPKALGNVVYNLANNQGRIRGAAGGGTQKTGTWRICFLSTGEAALLEIIPVVYSGLDVRIIPVPGKTLDAFDGVQAEYLNTVIRKNYGFLGPMIVDYLRTADTTELEWQRQEIIRELRYDVGMGDNIQRRKAESYSMLILAVNTLEKILPQFKEQFEEIHYNLWDHWREISEVHLTDQIAQEALSVLMDYYSTNEVAFTSQKDWGQRLGKVHNGKIHFLKASWAKALTQSYTKFSPQNVLREFIERGWLETDKDGRPDLRVSWGSSHHKARVYVLTPLALEEYEAAFKSKVTSYLDYLYERTDPDAIAGGPKMLSTSLPEVFAVNAQ